MRLRPARPADLEALLAISLATGDAGEDVSRLYRDGDLIGLLYSAPYLALEPDLALVAEDAPRLTPADVVEACPAHLHLNLLAHARGRGLGRRLLAAWPERLDAAGPPACTSASTHRAKAGSPSGRLAASHRSRRRR